MRSLDIRPVRSAGDWREFHRLWRRIYRHDPAAVRPLDSEQRLLLDTKRNPFWDHAVYEAFVCRSAGRPVGRIAAIVDHMHQEYYADRTGFFGFYESEDDPVVAGALLKAASDWLTARGCDRVRGPVNPSLKGEFGVVIKGNEYPPTVVMAHTPAWYDRLFSGVGLRKLHDFYAFTTDRAGILAKREHWETLSKASQRILTRHPELSLRTATPDDVIPTLMEVNRLGNRVRNVVFGFVPFTDAEIEFLVNSHRGVIVPELVLTVRRGETIAGYLIAVPDVNWALARARGPIDFVRLMQMPFLLRRIPRVRVIAMGTDPQYRTTGLITLLFKGVVDATVFRFDDFEMSWVSEANLASLKAIRHVIPIEPEKTYRLYEAPLPLASAG